MIIFFSLNSIIFIVLLFVLLILSVFNSAIQIYSILETYIIIIILFLIIRAVSSVASYVLSSKKHNYDISKNRVIVEIVSNILYIVAFCLFIHDMAMLQPEHPVITAICSIFSIYSIGFSLIGSINFNDFFDTGEDYATTILLGVISVLIIISAMISSIGLKIFLYLITAFISSIGYKVILDSK